MIIHFEKGEMKNMHKGVYIVGQYFLLLILKPYVFHDNNDRVSISAVPMDRYSF